MKDKIRASLPIDTEQNEVFFFFSGHGYQSSDDIYFCATDFSSRRPNETGVSHTELFEIFRASQPRTLVCVFDACYSGARLIKEAMTIPLASKAGLSSVIQFSSSLTDQASFGGEKLSVFSESFIDAVLSKKSGPIYYSDIRSSLRDHFLSSPFQTPFFVDQGTGREVIIDDPQKLSPLVEAVATRWTKVGKPVDGELDTETTGAVAVSTPLEILNMLEENITSLEQANTFIDHLCEALKTALEAEVFSDCFTLDSFEKSYYDGSYLREYMIRVLSKEERVDALVTAEIKRSKKAPSWQTKLMGLPPLMVDEEWEDHYDLTLNCSLSRAQIDFNFSPKFGALSKIKLSLAFAPSLTHCYVFQVITSHAKSDWHDYLEDGAIVKRRWYKAEWKSKLPELVLNCCDDISGAVEDHISAVVSRARKNS